MRTKHFLTGIVILLCTFVLIAIRTARSIPNLVLEDYLPKSVADSFVVEESKLQNRSKDAEIFWRTAHSRKDLGEMLGTEFHRCDERDKTWTQKALRKNFGDKFVPEATDVVYGKDTPSFDVFVLIKETQTNSFVMVLKK